MPELEFSESSPTGVEVQTLAVFALSGEGDGGPRPTSDAEAVGSALEIELAEELLAVRFDGKLGSVARIPTRGKASADMLLVVGLGSSPDLEGLRKAAACAARNANKDAALAVVTPSGVVDDASDQERGLAVAEGAGLGAYAFTAYRTKTNDLPSLSSVHILAGNGADADAVRSGVELAAVLVRATNIARDLVNEPPAGKRPPALARRVAELAEEAGLTVTIHDEEALADGGFGGILGVGQGSSEPPRLVELTYDPSPSQGHVILVGKGITFDSGGLSLKPANAMATMKCDMSGAAAVVGALLAIAELAPGTKVTGLLALAENMPSGTATRVSDVLRHRGGKTVEVMNTDAEGRLVLADALAYGAEMEPDAMVDIATLTGAQVVALGNGITAVMGTDDRLIDGLVAAGAAEGERIWRLPLPDDYREHLKSEVADMKNIGKPQQAGTIVAGLFLSEFVGEAPWAHLDIAGPAFSEEGDAFYTGRGGTGVGVRTLTRYVLDRDR